MSATRIREQLTRSVAETGRITAETFRSLRAEAERAGMDPATQRALLEPDRYLAVAPELRAKGLTLDKVVIEKEALAEARGLAKTLGTEAFPMMLKARGQSKPKTKVEKAAAELKKALEKSEPLGPRENWKITTPGADITFSVDVQGTRYPALVLDKPVWKDPSPKDIFAAHASRWPGVTTAAALKTQIQEVLAAEATYLAADGVTVRSNNERYGIQGLRREAFFSQLKEAVANGGINLSPTEKTLALGVLAQAQESLLLGKDYAMQIGSHRNYWPYWANYLGALIKMADQTAPGSDSAGIIENRIRDIMRHKTVFGRQLQLDEHDFEKTANAALVSQPAYEARPGRRVSLTSTSDRERPSYEILTVKSQLPANLSAWAGAPVYRDGTELYLDLVKSGPFAGRAGEKLPAEVSAHLDAKAVINTDDLTLRALEGQEKPRNQVSLDWDGNGGINVAKIFIGWWGHCHNEAPLNAMGVDPRRAVTLYREDRALAADKASNTYTPEDLWDVAGAFVSDGEDGWSTNGVRADTSVEKTTFVGDRNNGKSQLHLKRPNGSYASFDAKLVGVTEKNSTTPLADPLSLFRATVAQPDGSFTANPDYVGQKFRLRERDLIGVDPSDRKLTLETRSLTFDSRGYRTEEKRKVTVDPTRDEAVLLSEEITKRDQPRGGELRQHWYNPAKKEYHTVDVAVKAEGESARRTELAKGRPEKISEVAAIAETTYDSAKEIHGFVTENIGLPFTFDTDPSDPVWNYPVKDVRLDKLNEVTKNEGGQNFTYTTYKLHYATMGGPTEAGSDHRYTIKRDAAGRPVDAMALDPMPDFAFRQDHWVSAPVVVDDRGNRAVNLKAKNAGYLTRQNSATVRGDLWQRQADILYAGLRAEPKGNGKETYLYELDEGTLVAFSDKAVFEAAKKADLTLRTLANTKTRDADEDAASCCLPFWRRRAA